MVNEAAIVIPPQSTLYHDFWKQFRLFTSAFEELSFRYWYLVPLAFCIILAVLDSNLDLRQGVNILYVFSHEGNYYGRALSFTRYDLTDLPLLFAILAFTLTSFVFSRWCRGVPDLFWQLYAMGRVFSRDTRQKIKQEDYLRFLAQYQQSLASWRRYLVLGVFLLVALVLLLFLAPPQIAAVISSPAPDGFSTVLAVLRWPLFLMVIPALAIAYYVALALWVLAITGWYVRELTIQFQLVIQPHHPDRCGGLRPFGKFCLGLASPILTAAFFLGMYGIAFALVTEGTSVFIGFANLLLFVITFLLATLAFFLPLWNVHRRMITRKLESEEDCSLLFVVLEARLRSSLHNGEIEKARDARDGLELTRALYPRKMAYPLWPFDRRLFLAYMLPLLVPLLSLLVALNAGGLLGRALGGLWQLLSGHPLA